MSQMNPFTVAEEDNIIQARLSNDEKGLRQLSKRLFNSKSQQDYQSTLIELQRFKLQMNRSHLFESAIRVQSIEAETERERMEEECNSIVEQNKQLLFELEQAQLDRQRKMEYDALASEILGYPSRDDSSQAIDALENSIRQLHETKELQRNTFSRRAVTFAEILDACERLRGDVGAEAEEGRRRALLEMELEGEAEQQPQKSKLDPSAAVFEPVQSKKADLEEGEEDEEQ